MALAIHLSAEITSTVKANSHSEGACLTGPSLLRHASVSITVSTIPTHTRCRTTLSTPQPNRVEVTARSRWAIQPTPVVRTAQLTAFMRSRMLMAAMHTGPRTAEDRLCTCQFRRNIFSRMGVSSNNNSRSITHARRYLSKGRWLRKDLHPVHKEGHRHPHTFKHRLSATLFSLEVIVPAERSSRNPTIPYPQSLRHRLLPKSPRNAVVGSRGGLAKTTEIDFLDRHHPLRQLILMHWSILDFFIQLLRRDCFTLQRVRMERGTDAQRHAFTWSLRARAF